MNTISEPVLKGQRSHGELKPFDQPFFCVWTEIWFHKPTFSGIVFILQPYRILSV